MARVDGGGGGLRVTIGGLDGFQAKVAGLAGADTWLREAHAKVARLDVERERQYLVESIAKTGRGNNSGRLETAVLDPRNTTATSRGYEINTFLERSPAQLYARAIEFGLSAGFVGRVIHGGFATSTGGRGRPMWSAGGTGLYAPSPRSRRTSPQFVSVPTIGPAPMRGSVGYGTITKPIAPHRYAAQTRRFISQGGTKRLKRAYRQSFPVQYRGLIPPE